MGPNGKLFEAKLDVPRGGSGESRAGKSERADWIGLE